MTRRILLSCSAVLLAGCGDPQPAVPLERSIPLAVTLVAVAAAPAVLVTRWLFRRTLPVRDLSSGWTLPTAPVSRTRVVAVICASSVAAPLSLAAFHLVAFSFAEAHVDIFTYGEVVTFATCVLAAASASWCVLLGVAGGLCSPSSIVRDRTRLGVWVAVVLSTVLLIIPLSVVLGLLLLASRRLEPEPDLASLGALRVPAEPVGQTR